MAFSTQRGGRVNIWSAPANGSGPGERAAEGAEVLGFSAASCTRDGKWIAYASNDAGKYLVYIQPFLAPGGRTLISASGAGEPAWASINELAYVNMDADSVILARLEFGATIKVARTGLFDYRLYQGGGASFRNFDVSRDGKSFVFVKSVGRSAWGEPIIVLNWMEEVKRLMAAAGTK